MFVLCRRSGRDGEGDEARQDRGERSPAGVCSHLVRRGSELPQGHGVCRQLRLGEPLQHDLPGQTGVCGMNVCICTCTSLCAISTSNTVHVTTHVHTPCLALFFFYRLLQKHSTPLQMTWTCMSSMTSLTTLPNLRNTYPPYAPVIIHVTRT